MPNLLTRRKQKWIENRNIDVIYGEPLNPNMAVSLRYYARLEREIGKMCADVEKQLRKLFKASGVEEMYAQDASISSQARILTNALTNKFNDLFSTIAKPEAERMAEEANKASSAAVHNSLQKLTGGLSLSTASLKSGSLNEILSATVTENVSLIKSISSQYLSGVQGAVMRSITTGQGLKDLIPYLEKHKAITHRRARMIAYDQTRKAFEGLSRGRMVALGIKEFQWLHSGGSNHPRKEHIEMSGKIYSFENPPVIEKSTGKRGYPGDLVNCRCRQKPVLRLDGKVNKQ